MLSEVTFSSGLGLLVYGLIGGSSHAWTSTRVVGPLAGAAVLLIAFIIAELRQDRPMFDMSLLRVPTFVGGLASAFAMNASMFAMLTFIVLYLQDVLHLSAIQTGVRMLVLSGAVFVSAGLAGRLSSKVPARLLIGPGFVLVGTGLLLMRGITASTSWTHFVPGFIVAGVGAGLVNTPLASVAVGVVHPRRAGMASGINSTFRQVGIAAGVAALGSIFANNIRTSVTSALAHTPAAPQAHQIASAVASGHAQQAIAHVPVRGCWKWHREHNLVPGTPGAPALQPLETDVAHDAEPPCTPLMSRRKRLLVSSGN
ncbi:MAG: MFS transporter [Solirubrobacteraceae bacterium]